MTRSIRALAAATILVAAVNIAAGLSAAPQSDGGRRTGGGAVSAAAARANHRYIVRMADLPVSSYDGRVQAMPATRPVRGQKIDRRGAAVIGYAAYLDSRHDEALDRVGGARKVYDYRFSFNGFAAELTERQAEVLKSVAGVLSVARDDLQSMDTASTPRFLDLDGPGGLWDRLGGTRRAGENVIIGVIDSGIWPESDSFSDRRARGRGWDGSDDEDFSFDHTPPWTGECEVSVTFPESACNQKLIGARHFNAAWGGDAGIGADMPWEYLSPRDYNGHGTHTASTAGGNFGVKTIGPTRVFGRISGMAPRARIAAYKALWSTQDGSQANGFNSDLMAAVDQAVADGVDVINYSVSGTAINFLDSVEVAFLFAADAGVFVSASAGNSGPTASTVAHPSPWITTVAAGTHDRSGIGSVKLGNGTSYRGRSLATAVPAKRLILAATAKTSTATVTAAQLCFSTEDNGGVPALDPAKVSGKIVVCDRGMNGRLSKSLAVQEAGGVGMVLVNTAAAQTLDADFHSVPTVHLSDVDGVAVKAYAAGAKPTASIPQASLVFDIPAPTIASFSSRGPLRAGNGDLLKPDVIAPGVAIVAAVAPPANNGFSFNVYDGTSMSAPHVAGLAALLKDLHPDWTPMMIKSALMTTAYDVIDGPNTDPGIVFGQGAGHVRPNRAANPGLVFDSNANDWFAFLCGATSGVNPTLCSALVGAGYSTAPSDLNLASISIGNMVGAQTVTRTVTNVGHGAATYTPVVTGLAGVQVDIKPKRLTVRPGQSKSFTVTFTRTTATLNTYAAGQLTLNDGTHRVRLPLLVRPVPLAAPVEVSGTGGPITYTVGFGFDGPFTATARGLIPAALTSGSVADDPGDNFVAGGPGTFAVPVTIAAGTTYARFSLFESQVTPGSDLDLYLVKGSMLIAVSGNTASTEEIDLVNPAAGSDYVLYVHGFDVATTAAFTVNQWLLGSTAAGNMTVTAPGTATAGNTGTIGLTFSGLTPATRYLGSVAYTGAAGIATPTIVRVDTP